MSGFADFATAFASQVTPLKVGIGKRDLASHVTAPYYFMEPLSEAFPGPRGMGGSGVNAPGLGQPGLTRNMAERQLTIAIHSWGQDFNQAETLNAIAIAALRAAMAGGNSYDLQGAEWNNPANEVSAYALVLKVMLRLTLPLQKVPPVLTTFPLDSSAIAVPNLFVFDTSNHVAGKIDAGSG